MSQFLRLLALGGLALSATLAHAQQPPRVRFPDQPDDPVVPDRFADDQGLDLQIDGRFQSSQQSAASDSGVLIGDIEERPGDDRFLDRRVPWSKRVRQRSEDLRRGEEWQAPPPDNPRFITQPPRVAVNSDPTQDVNRDELRTHATSMMNPLENPPNRIHANNSAIGERPSVTEASTAMDPFANRAGAETDESEASGNVSPQVEQGRESKRKPLPLWAMLLFASLAANVFFCWSARIAHVKYQDLVADLSEGDARQQRYERRLRRTEEAIPERDEIEFLGTVDA